MAVPFAKCRKWDSSFSDQDDPALRASAEPSSEGEATPVLQSWPQLCSLQRLCAAPAPQAVVGAPALHTHEEETPNREARSLGPRTVARRPGPLGLLCRRKSALTSSLSLGRPVMCVQPGLEEKRQETPRAARASGQGSELPKGSPASGCLLLLVLLRPACPLRPGLASSALL